MYCKRMHLTERRYKIPPEIKDGPIIRPCSTRPLDDETITSPRLKRSVNGPAISSTSSSSLSSSQEKTPLIVMTLTIPSEVKTLAPKELKRYPRKQPSFCQQQQQQLITTTIRQLEQQEQEHLNKHNNYNLPDIFIRGFVIRSDTNKMDGLIYETKDEQLHCEIPIDSPRSHEGLFGINLNYDGYEMDSYGHLPGDSCTPTPKGIPKYMLRKRTPSPNTRQVIRVDVSCNQRNGLNGSKLKKKR